jgi:hypothetical protein
LCGVQGMPRPRRVEEEAEALAIPTLVDEAVEEVGITAGMSGSDSIESVSNMLARLMGGDVPLTTPRTDAEIGAFLSGMGPSERGKLSPAEKAKLRLRAIEGIEKKFSIMPVMTDSRPSKEKLKSLYSVTTRIDDFRRAVRGDNMINVFTIPLEYDSTGIPSSDKAMDLFTQYKQISLETVLMASRFYNKYGGMFTAENCNWTGLKLLASCEEDLQVKILSTTSILHPSEQSGPVYFKIMMNHVMATSESAMRTVQDVLRGLKLSDFDGENVSDAVGAIRGLTEQLTNNNALPGDVVEIVSTIMQATTVSEFETFVQQQYGYHDSGLKKFQLSDFLDVLEIKYRTMTGVSGKWTAATTKSNQVSVFFSGKCRYCNKKGHKQEDCWKLKEDKGERALVVDGAVALQAMLIEHLLNQVNLMSESRMA